MPSEYGEPWKLDVTPEGPYVIDREGESMCCFVGIPSDELFSAVESNFQRIVACINACRGIPTVDLDGGIICDAILAAHIDGWSFSDATEEYVRHWEAIRKSEFEERRNAVAVDQPSTTQ